MLNKKIITAPVLALCLFNSFEGIAQNTSEVTAAQTTTPGLNPALIVMIGVAVIFLLCIALLGYILINVSALDSGLPKEKGSSTSFFQKTTVLVLGLLGTSFFAKAQTGTTTEVVNSTQKATSIIGLSPTAFFLLVLTLCIEVIVMLVLLWNIWNFIKKARPEMAAQTVEEKKEARKFNLNWWEKFNSLKPIAQEQNLDTGHDYDGIRELNNKLPAWWLYGFYASILFAAIYLWRFHVSHSAPLAAEEYNISVATAAEKTKAYLAAKGEVIDENTVTLLSDKTDISAGKAIFEKSCAACHLADGGGMVGPNLTDNFWLHGGDIKSVFKTIKYGINAMPQWQTSYSNKEIAQVASFVESLKGTKPATPKAPEGVEVK